MSPDALRERTFHFGTIRARQSISVLGSDARAYIYVCTTFSVPLAEGGFAHHAGGSHVEFADADMLTDESKREQLALQQMGKLADDLRLAANTLSLALSERAQADAQAKKEARESLEAEVGALSW